jgi:hypothetical protein
MYQKCVLIPLLVGLVFIFVSCPQDNGKPIDYVPPVIGIQFTVVNNLDKTVQMSIRHAYDIREKKHWRYSDWSEAVTIQPGTSQSIGNETARFTYKDKTETMSGFILWDKSFDDFDSYAQSFSFEVKVQTPDTTHYLAGFETTELKFAATKLGEMKITGDFYIRNAHFCFNEKEYARLRSPVLIPATLTINADGTYDIEYDEEVLQNHSLPYRLSVKDTMSFKKL